MFKNDVNRWFSACRNKDLGSGVLLAIKGTICVVESSNEINDSSHEDPYWVAEACTLVRKAAKIVDPGNEPGDIIPKGSFFLKVKYYHLWQAGALKYIGIRSSAAKVKLADYSRWMDAPMGLYAIRFLSMGYYDYPVFQR